MAKVKSFFDLTAVDIDGKTVKFSDYKDKKKAFIVTNVASRCGHTKRHYTEYQELYEKYK
jgi:glutathione peroxidase